MIEPFNFEWSDETGLNSPHASFHIIVTKIATDARRECNWQDECSVRSNEASPYFQFVDIIKMLADVSEVHAVSIFSVEMYRRGTCPHSVSLFSSVDLQNRMMYIYARTHTETI
jgi:hypothetical protein